MARGASRVLRPAWLAGLAMALAAAPGEAATGAVAETIYFGGPILTMEGKAPVAEALAVGAGKILAVGSKAEVLKRQGKATRMVDLAGKALLPGFIDAHGHLWNVGLQKLGANLLAPPDGKATDIQSVVQLLKGWAGSDGRAVSQAGWIFGFGPDDAELAEKRMPTASDLDRVSKDVPVFVIHPSGHLGSLNHRALEMAGITAVSKDPPGGIIRREKDGSAPDGVLEEMAWFGPLARLVGTLNPQANARIALGGVEAYVSNGFTTAQEGRATAANIDTWRRLGKAGLLPIDVAIYPDFQGAQDVLLKGGTSRTYQDRVRVAGAKLGVDGSPQGKTAWLTQPYEVPPLGLPRDYRGYPAIPNPADLDSLVALAFKNKWQLLVHCNGDAAADAMIEAVTKAAKAHGNSNRRAVMVHAQTVRDDQLDRMKALGIIPSFFGMHTYYWGDWYRDSVLGKERAYRISPAGSALRKGMLFTEHHDAPVALPSAAMILYATVNRVSRRGDVIGPDERVPVMEALKSITINAAHQYFEEDRKGSLKPGKLADLVILDQNPLAIDPLALKDLRVLATIKEGKTVFKAH